jgi:hypothetical protein
MNTLQIKMTMISNLTDKMKNVLEQNELIHNRIELRTGINHKKMMILNIMKK